MKLLCEIVERTLTVFLSAMACMGMFLTGCLFGNLLLDEVTTATMWTIFLGCVILTYGAIQIMLQARYQRLLLMAEEGLFDKDEEAQKLMEHLKV